MENNREFTVQLTFKEFVKGSLQMMNKAVQIAGLMTILSIIVIVTLAIIDHKFNWDSIFFPLMVFFFIFFFYNGLRRTWKNNESIRKPVHYSYNDSEIEIYTDNASSKTSWEALFKWVETKEFFLVFPQERMSWMITKSSFKNQEQMDDFRNILQRQIPQKPQSKFPFWLRAIVMWVGAVVILTIGYLLFFAR